MVEHPHNPSDKPNEADVLEAFHKAKARFEIEYIRLESDTLVSRPDHEEKWYVVGYSREHDSYLLGRGRKFAKVSATDLQQANTDVVLPGSQNAVTSVIKDAGAVIRAQAGMIAEQADDPQAHAESVWGKFKSSHLKEEIALLSEEEKQVVNECAADLARSIPAGEHRRFMAISKNNGIWVSGRWHSGVEEHHEKYFVEPTEGHRVLDSALTADILKNRPRTIYAAFDKDADIYTWTARIFPYPGKDKLRMLQTGMRVPHNCSGADARGAGCNFSVIVPADALFLTHLKKEQGHARLLPFILRNAAMLLNEEQALKVLDAPIGAPSAPMGKHTRKPHTIYIADFCDQSVISANDAGASGAAIQTYADESEFAEACSGFSSGPVEREMDVTKQVPNRIFWGTHAVTTKERRPIPPEQVTVEDLKRDYRFIVW